jgi:hypothetical protein
VPKTQDTGEWSPLGKWDSRYQGLTELPQSDGVIAGYPRYGKIASYHMGAIFLRDCAHVEDWGCGYGTFRKFCLSPAYVGIDGSQSPAADRVVDLCTYTSHAEGVFLRHVLEHNADGWRDILLNALRSFSRRMVLVIYTPFGDVTRNVRARTPSDVNVPTALSFRKEDITDLFPEDVAWFTVVGDPLETYETMFFLERGQDRCMHLLRHDVCYLADFSGNL